MPNPKRILRGPASLGRALDLRLTARSPQATPPGARLPLGLPPTTGRAAMSSLAGGSTPGGGSGGASPAYPEDVAILDGAQTLNHKRLVPRIASVSSSATPAINTDAVDYFAIPALAVNITNMSAHLTGTPTPGQRLHLAVTATSGTPSIAWGSGFESSTIALPSAASTSRLDLDFIWNEASSAWRIIGSA